MFQPFSRDQGFGEKRCLVRGKGGSQETNECAQWPKAKLLWIAKCNVIVGKMYGEVYREYISHFICLCVRSGFFGHSFILWCATFDRFCVHFVLSLLSSTYCILLSQVQKRSKNAKMVALRSVITLTLASRFVVLASALPHSYGTHQQRAVDVAALILGQTRPQPPTRAQLKT